jgi:glycerol-3-phosphate dehydrogenase (NAD(P)+)
VLQEAARDAGVDMPVCEAVCALLSGQPVREVVGALLSRPLREEAQ